MLHHLIKGSSLVVQIVKNLSAIQETWVESLGWEDPLEEGMATHSPVVLPGESPWTGYSLSSWWATAHELAQRWMLLSD